MQEIMEIWGYPGNMIVNTNIFLNEVLKQMV